MSAPLEVELPVCDICGRVGKAPNAGSFASACTGPIGNTHKRRWMRLSRFVEATPFEGDPEHPNEREYQCPGCGNAVWKKPGPGRPPKCEACKAAGR